MSHAATDLSSLISRARNFREFNELENCVNRRSTYTLIIFLRDVQLAISSQALISLHYVSISESVWPIVGVKG